MTPLRLFAVAFIFLAASVSWLVLGGVMTHRTTSQAAELRGKVADLWGQPQSQAGPAVAFVHTAAHDVVRTETASGVERQIRERVEETKTEDVSLDSTHVAVDLHYDARLKGLMWHALYDVTFHGAWTYVHADARAGNLRVSFRFPDPSGVYDGFRFSVDGQTRDVRPKDGELQVLVPVTPGQKVAFAVEYKSRGTDEWRYVAGPGVASLKDFRVTMTTDFADIDFPGGTLSPSTRERRGEGWALGWAFERVVTGKAIGMTMPQHIQPGELAAALSFSAPVSLLFFFLVLMVLARLRGLDIHPLNYAFLGGAFFAFHLLFAYSVDHVSIRAAFAMASAVSIFLVASYLRLVVSARFAYVEAALAQLVYLIGFSLAHFWEGFTGLTVTVLSILTLFLLMQLTGGIRWSVALAPKRPAEAHA
jgi:Inner membrane protein CreD